MARQVLNGAAITGATTATGTVAGSAVLTIKGAASQTADLTQWQNSGGTTLAAFTNLGTLLFAGDTNLYRTSANTLKTDGALVLLGSRYGASSSALLSINTGSVSNEGIIVRGVASQTADLQQWQDSSANLLIRITKDGSLQSSDAIAHGLGSSITSGVILTVGSGGNTGVIPLVVRGAASQVANLTEWRNSAGTALTRIDWNGTIWAGAVVVDSADTATRIFFGSALDVSAFRSGVNTLRLDGTLEVNKSLNVGGDDLGKLYFGSVYDTNLYRSAADKLKTDDEFIVAGNRMYILGNGWPGVIFRNASNAERASIVVGHADGELYLDYGVGGGTNAEVYFRSGSSYTTRLVIGNDGKLYPGPSPGDTNLYRGAANTLRTDDQFIANSRVSATDGTNAIDLATAGGVNYIQSGPFGSGGATDLWIGGMYGVGGEFMAMNASKVRIGSGTITFGGAEDTNLYRSTANTLRTDDSLVVSGNLFSVNAIVAGSTGGLGGVLNALSPNAGQLVEVVRGAAGQTADLTQWQDSTGAALARVTSNGMLVEKQVVFTPTTVGWYRIIASGSAVAGGMLRLSAGYDNAVTDIELQFNIGGYGTNGSIQQTRFSSYNQGVISQARISSDSGNNCYLDIYVSSAATPGPITVQGFGPWLQYAVFFVASPVVGATAGSTNVQTLILEHGFLTTSAVRVQAQRATSSVPLTITGMAGQTGDIAQWQNSAGNPLLAVNASGTLLFGTAQDTNLYRSAADVLKTDDHLIVAGALEVQHGFGISLPHDSSFGIRFGTSLDTNLYRGAADVLTTDDTFVVGGDLITISEGAVLGTDAISGIRLGFAKKSGLDPVITAASTTPLQLGHWSTTTLRGGNIASGSFTPRLTLNTDGTISLGGGLVWNGDTNLYRAAADYLKTDDNLIVGSTLTVFGSNISQTATGYAGLIVNSLTSGNPYLTLRLDGADKGSIYYDRATDRLIFTSGATDWMTLTAAGRMGIGGTQSPYGNAVVSVNTMATTNPGIVVRGVASQTADLQQWQNNAGTVLSSIRNDGMFRGPAFGDLADVGPYMLPGANSLFILNRTATSNNVFIVRGMASQTGDLQQWQNSAGNPLLAVNASGTLLFGTAQDTNLYRSGANEVRTDDSLLVGLNAYVYGSVIVDYDTTGQGLFFGAALDTNLYRVGADSLKTDDNFTVGGAYLLANANVIVDNGNFGSKLFFGTLNDSNLYRGGANTLKTDSSFEVAGSYFVAAGTVVVDGASAGGKLIFGSANDTNLYRYAADSLKTDDHLYVAGTIVAGATVSDDNSYSYTNHGAVIASRGVDGTAAVTPVLSLMRDGTSSVIYAQNAEFRLARTTATGTDARTELQLRLAHTTTTDLIDLMTWRSDGKILIGAGADTNLYRSAADTLKTDDSLVVAGQAGITSLSTSGVFFHNPASAAGNSFRISVGSEANDKFNIRYDGLVQWGAGGATALDTNLYRSGANELRTDDHFVGEQNVHVGHSGSGSLYFGAANDTNLYRSTANVLKTDDFFLAAGSIRTTGEYLQSDNETYVGGPLFFGPAGGAGPWDVKLYRVAADNLRSDDMVSVLTDLHIAINNTGKLYFGSAQDTNLYRYGADILKTDDYFYSAVGISANIGTANAAHLGFTGPSTAGPGVVFGSAADTNLYRGAANVLATDDLLGLAKVAGTAADLGGSNVGDKIALYGGNYGIGIQASRLVAYVDAGAGFGVRQVSATGNASSGADIFTLHTDGKLYFGSAADTNLYRNGANQLRTDDDFFTKSAIVNMNDTDGKLYFGSAFDTNLYRSTADTLRTDDSLVVSGNLFSVNAIVAGSTGGLGGVLNALSPNAGQLVVAVRGAASQTADLTQWQNSAGNPLLAVNASGTLLFGTAQDTNLYRGAANILQTDDDFYAQQLRVTTNAVIAGDDTFTSKLYIGATPATRVTLYRSSDGVLATDNLFNASAAGIRTKHEGNSTVPSVVSSSGQLRASTGRLWMNDAGTWRQLPGPFRFARRIAGNITVNSTSWVDIGDTSLDIVLDAAVGDVLEASINALWGNEALNGYLDVVTVINGGPLGFFSSDATTQASDGIVGWGANSGQWDKVGSPIMYTVQSGDLVGGKVRLRLRTRTSSASNKTLYATGTDRLFWSVKNLGSVSFQPTDLSGLQMWLAADWLFGLSDGNEVATWADMSGNGRDLTQATSSKRPTYKTNILSGLPVVRFDGADDNLARASVTSSSLFGANTATIFVVQKQVGTEASNVTFVWESTANTNRVLAHLSLSDTLYFDYGNLSGGGRISGAQPAGWDDAWKVIGLHRNGTAGKVTVNGVDAFTGTYSDDLDSATATFYLGADSVDTLNGDIAEFIIYNRALSAAEYLQVQRYLGAKYAIAVA